MIYLLSVVVVYFAFAFLIAWAIEDFDKRKNNKL